MWHACIAHGKFTRSDEVRRGMPSSPLGSTHDRTTTSVACHHRPWTAYTVGLRQAWHAIMAMANTHGQTKSSVARHNLLWTIQATGQRHTWHASMALIKHTHSDDVVRGMPSSPLDSIHGHTMSRVAYNYCLWIEHISLRYRAWHAIIVVG